MKRIREAIELSLPHFEPLGVERVSLLDALGKPLAIDLAARGDLPRFDNSAMDGYAVRHADLGDAPCELPLWGATRAGDAAPATLPPGHAQRIFTGALLPRGADTVIIQEHAQAQAAHVRFERIPQTGANVRGRGTDLRAGELALSAGSVIGAGEIGLLASQGYASVPVFRAPRVAIVCSGDELRDIGEPLGPDGIVNSNAYALYAQVRQAGADPWLLPATADSSQQLQVTLQRALRADVLLTVGGVSVGDHDLIADALSLLGIEPLFWKVAMKPGKPLLFAKHGAVPIVGLPGNPASTFVGFELFVRPGLRRMLGHRALFRATAQVKLEAALRRKPGRTELARASLVPGADGPRARLCARQGSGSLPSLSGVDALLVLPEARDEFAAGEPVLALLLREGASSEIAFD